MKNSIKQTRAAEAAANEARETEEAIQAQLDAVEPVDMVGAITEVKDGSVHVYRDEDGNSVGTNGGKYIQVPDGNGSTIAAKTNEEIAVIKDRMSRGIAGDGMLHKTVIIGGIPCDCCGATEEELKKDIIAARIYAAKHGYGILRDIDVAEQLVDAGYEQSDLEVVEDDFILCYSGKYIMDTNGNTIVTLSDIKSKLTKEEVKTLLTERLNAWIREQAESYYDEEDEYYDESEDDDLE